MEESVVVDRCLKARLIGGGLNSIRRGRRKGPRRHIDN